MRGFTLIELLIALAILALATTLLFNGLRLGARTWDAIESRTRPAQELHLAGAFLRRQLEQAQLPAFRDTDGEKRVPFFGERDAVRFVAPLPAHFDGGGLHWFSLGVAQAPDGARLVLSHELFQGENWQRFAAAAPESAVLAQGLRRVELDYLGYDSATWLARWGDKERPPRLVRLRLEGREASLELLVSPKVAAR
jgi:general secretion pathway protein J